MRTPSLSTMTLGLLPFGVPLGVICASACAPPPPDTTPAVQILSPSNNTHLPAGKAITVTFAVGGIDENSAPDKDGKKPRFALEASQTRRPGFGRVVAYFDGTTIQAVTSKETEALIVPGPPGFGFTSAERLIVPGKAKLSLFLQYNDGTPVEPQHPGEVDVIVDP